ncbi:Os04g0191500, partial [Oryza sativa Japonica Group]
INKCALSSKFADHTKMKVSTVAVLVMVAMLMMSVAVYSDDASSHGVTEKQVAAAANAHGSNGGSVVTEAASTDSTAGASGTSSAGASGTNIDSNYYVTMKGYMEYMRKYGGKQP